MDLLLVLSAVVFQACQEKNRVDELKDFVEQICEEGGTYTEEQWEKVNNKFSELLEKTGVIRRLDAGRTERNSPAARKVCRRSLQKTRATVSART